MANNSNEARLKTFTDQLVVQLRQIPTPEETQQFLVADAVTRMRILQACRKRARPLIEMLNTLEVYKNVS